MDAARSVVSCQRTGAYRNWLGYVLAQQIGWYGAGGIMFAMAVMMAILTIKPVFGKKMHAKTGVMVVGISIFVLIFAAKQDYSFPQTGPHPAIK